MKEVLAELTKYPIKTRLSLTGTLIVARDIAHARIKAMLDAGKPMPEYFKNHPGALNAGPAKTPSGMPSRQLRSYHRRTYGPVRGRIPETRRFYDHGCQGQPFAYGA